jgi:hypothetical protein
MNRWRGPVQWWRTWWLYTADRTTAPGGCARCGDAHPPGAHRFGGAPSPSGARTTSFRCTSTRWAVRAPARPAHGSGAHRVDSVRWSGPGWGQCVSP